ncbi:MAG: hypothetical protein IT428_26430 [Planctomycetaceae bacterium]|nr:hypothetical protein [Planctomycetaceae bacterium]
MSKKKIAKKSKKNKRRSRTYADPSVVIPGILKVLPERWADCTARIERLSENSTEQDLFAAIQAVESCVRMLRDFNAVHARARILRHQSSKPTKFDGNHHDGREPTEKQLKAMKSNAIILDAQGQTRRKGSRRST